MAKVSAYAPGAPAQAADEVYVARAGGLSRKLSVQQVLDALNVLTALTPAQSTDVLLVGRAGSSKKVTIADVLTLVPRRNLLVNGNFVVNQRAYTSGAVLAAGSYGHDRWKAGAAGGDYTFAQLPNSTTVTIAAGKTLVQVCEDKNVEGGDYALSWTGTAQARVGVNTAVPSGAYAASPVLIDGQTAGTTMSVEWNAGTLAEAMLAPGTVASPFERIDYEETLTRCRRYYRRFPSDAANAAYVAVGYCNSTTFALVPALIAAGMRATPTLGYSALGDIRAFTNGSPVALTALTIAAPATSPLLNVTVAAGFILGQAVDLIVNSGVGKYIDFAAEL